MPRKPQVAARKAFGNTTRIAEETRDVWRFAWLEEIWEDTRYGLRRLRHNPGFAVTASLTLAICLGANAAIFTIVNGVLFAFTLGSRS